ncbi:hypothetical protein EON67_11470, partial [archaeon]
MCVCVRGHTDPLALTDNPLNQRDFFSRREICFTMADDVFIRYLCFNNASEFAIAVRDKRPHKIDIGPVCSVRVRRAARRALLAVRCAQRALLAVRCVHACMRACSRERLRRRSFATLVRLQPDKNKTVQHFRHLQRELV